jgi:glutamine amidotransferase
MVTARDLPSDTEIRMIRIVDYGMGNLRSVQKAFAKLAVEAEFCSDPNEIATADKLVLPGVGAFRDSIGELRKRELVQPICDHIAANKPFLGICLGLQLLFDVSHEDGEWDGLGVTPGEVVRFEDQPGLKIPHMGWNQLDIVRPNPLLKNIPAGAYFYFVHSYYVVPTDESIVAATTDHGTQFTAMIARDNLFATQFHPEKSQRVGLQLLQNFAEL